MGRIYDSRARLKFTTSAVGAYGLVEGVRLSCCRTDIVLSEERSYRRPFDRCSVIRMQLHRLHVHPNINASCYSPPSLRRHASIAFNSYFQDKEQEAPTCTFGGTAIIVNDIHYRVEDGCNPTSCGVQLLESSGATLMPLCQATNAFILIGLMYAIEAIAS